MAHWWGCCCKPTAGQRQQHAEDEDEVFFALHQFPAASTFERSDEPLPQRHQRGRNRVDDNAEAGEQLGSVLVTAAQLLQNSVSGHRIGGVGATDDGGGGDVHDNPLRPHHRFSAPTAPRGPHLEGHLTRHRSKPNQHNVDDVRGALANTDHAAEKTLRRVLAKGVAHWWTQRYALDVAEREFVVYFYKSQRIVPVVYCIFVSTTVTIGALVLYLDIFRAGFAVLGGVVLGWGICGAQITRLKWACAKLVAGQRALTRRIKRQTSTEGNAVGEDGGGEAEVDDDVWAQEVEHLFDEDLLVAATLPAGAATTTTMPPNAVAAHGEPPTAPRTALRDNAAWHERMVAIIIGLNFAFLFALHGSKGSCNYLEASRRSMDCKSSIQNEGMGVAVFIVHVFLTPVRSFWHFRIAIGMFASYLLYVYFGASDHSDPNFATYFVSEVVLFITQLLISIAGVFLEERRRRAAFEVYVRRHQCAAMVEASKREAQRFVQVSMPITVVDHMGTLQSGKSLGTLFGFDPNTMVCCIALEGFASWSAARGACSAIQLLHNIAEGYDMLREAMFDDSGVDEASSAAAARTRRRRHRRYGPPTKHHALGDLYVVTSSRRIDDGGSDGAARIEERGSSSSAPEVDDEEGGCDDGAVVCAASFFQFALNACCVGTIGVLEAEHALMEQHPLCTTWDQTDRQRSTVYRTPSCGATAAATPYPPPDAPAAQAAPAADEPLGTTTKNSASTDACPMDSLDTAMRPPSPSAPSLWSGIALVGHFSRPSALPTTSQHTEVHHAHPQPLRQRPVLPLRIRGALDVGACGGMVFKDPTSGFRGWNAVGAAIAACTENIAVHVPDATVVHQNPMHCVATAPSLGSSNDNRDLVGGALMPVVVMTNRFYRSLKKSKNKEIDADWEGMGRSRLAPPFQPAPPSHTNGVDGSAHCTPGRASHHLESSRSDVDPEPTRQERTETKPRAPLLHRRTIRFSDHPTLASLLQTTTSSFFDAPPAATGGVQGDNGCCGTDAVQLLVATSGTVLVALNDPLEVVLDAAAGGGDGLQETERHQENPLSLLSERLQPPSLVAGPIGGRAEDALFPSTGKGSPSRLATDAMAGCTSVLPPSEDAKAGGDGATTSNPMGPEATCSLSQAPARLSTITMKTAATFANRTAVGEEGTVGAVAESERSQRFADDVVMRLGDDASTTMMATMDTTATTSASTTHRLRSPRRIPASSGARHKRIISMLQLASDVLLFPRFEDPAMEASYLTATYTDYDTSDHRFRMICSAVAQVFSIGALAIVGRLVYSGIADIPTMKAPSEDFTLWVLVAGGACVVQFVCSSKLRGVPPPVVVVDPCEHRDDHDREMGVVVAVGRANLRSSRGNTAAISAGDHPATSSRRRGGRLCDAAEFKTTSLRSVVTLLAFMMAMAAYSAAVMVAPNGNVIGDSHILFLVIPLTASLWRPLVFRPVVMWTTGDVPLCVAHFLRTYTEFSMSRSVRLTALYFDAFAIAFCVVLRYTRDGALRLVYASDRRVALLHEERQRLRLQLMAALEVVAPQKEVLRLLKRAEQNTLGLQMGRRQRGGARRGGDDGQRLPSGFLPTNLEQCVAEMRDVPFVVIDIAPPVPPHATTMPPRTTPLGSLGDFSALLNSISMETLHTTAARRASLDELYRTSSSSRRPRMVDERDWSTTWQGVLEAQCVVLQVVNDLSDFGMKVIRTSGTRTVLACMPQRERRGDKAGSLVLLTAVGLLQKRLGKTVGGADHVQRQGDATPGSEPTPAFSSGSPPSLQDQPPAPPDVRHRMLLHCCPLLPAVLGAGPVLCFDYFGPDVGAALQMIEHVPWGAVMGTERALRPAVVELTPNRLPIPNEHTEPDAFNAIVARLGSEVEWMRAGRGSSDADIATLCRSPSLRSFLHQADWFQFNHRRAPTTIRWDMLEPVTGGAESAYVATLGVPLPYKQRGLEKWYLRVVELAVTIYEL